MNHSHKFTGHLKLWAVLAILFIIQSISISPHLSAQMPVETCPVSIPDAMLNLALAVNMNDEDSVNNANNISRLSTNCINSPGEVIIAVAYDISIEVNRQGIPVPSAVVEILGEKMDIPLPPAGPAPVINVNGVLNQTRQLGNLTELETLPIKASVGCDTTKPDPMGRFATCMINAKFLVKRAIVDSVPPLPAETTPPGGAPNLPPLPDEPTLGFVSPKCVGPGKVVHLHGFRFHELERPLTVFIDEVQAEIVKVLPFIVHARVPQSVEGRVEVRVEGIDETRPLDVNPNCQHRHPGDDDLANGFLLGEIVVFLTETLDETELETFKEDFDFETLVEFPTVKMLRGVLIDKGPLETKLALDFLNVDDRVTNAFLNHVIRPHQADPQINNQPWLSDLGLPDGWDTFFPNRGAGITIAIIDTGADLTLPLEGSPEIVFNADAPNGLDYSPVEDNDDTAHDDLGHGTAVSTIAAGSVNEFNGTGVAPAADILPIKVFGLSGTEVVSSNNVVSHALEGAFAAEVDVINLSLGCAGCTVEDEADLRSYYGHLLDRLFEDQTANGKKVPIIVASTGNDSENLIDSPAAYSSVIAVGSLKSDLTARSSFSNYGEEIDFVAMGESTWTTLAGGIFGNAGSGTSYSAPQVAGLVALILGETPNLTVDEVIVKINECFVIDLGDPGFDNETGWGRIFIPPATDAPASCLP